jgi:hypothetical protein
MTAKIKAGKIYRNRHNGYFIVVSNALCKFTEDLWVEFYEIDRPHELLYQLTDMFPVDFEEYDVQSTDEG